MADTNIPGVPVGRRKVAKPTGVSGVFQVQVQPDGSVTAGFEQIPYSKEKAEIELMIAHAFIRSMNRELEKCGETFCLSNPRLNPERDFDLTVSTARGDADLELREIQLGIPYAQAPASYYSYQFARALLKAVRDKSKHYSRPSRELFLLLYSTHWAFSSDETALMCVRYWLTQDKPLFDAVFIYQPFDATEGVSHWIYPYPPELLGNFDPETVRDHQYLNLDPRKIAVI